MATTVLSPTPVNHSNFLLRTGPGDNVEYAFAPSSALSLGHAFQCGHSVNPFVIPGAKAGTVNTSGTTVTWVSGDQFESAMQGENITVNGIVYVVQTFNSATSLTLTVSAGSQSGVAYSTGGIVSGVVGMNLQAVFKATPHVLPPFPNQYEGMQIDVHLQEGADGTAIGLLLNGHLEGTWTESSAGKGGYQR